MSTREIAALRSELEVLRLRVQVLEERLIAREAERPSPTASAGSEGFSVVTSAPGQSGYILAEDTEERLELAKVCGRFLRRAYSGVYRGTSGRDRLKLGSRVYVVLADFSGRKFDQPKVFERFSEVKDLCKRGPDAGSSVFLGFATQWEAKLAVKEAGFEWPSRR